MIFLIIILLSSGTGKLLALILSKNFFAVSCIFCLVLFSISLNRTQWVDPHRDTCSKMVEATLSSIPLPSNPASALCKRRSETPLVIWGEVLLLKGGGRRNVSNHPVCRSSLGHNSISTVLLFQDHLRKLHDLELYTFYICCLFVVSHHLMMIIIIIIGAGLSEEH
uniref:Uncharacterized protein n=1 Tax=Micrurus corallinus TaxID=54390 RepID=A0A2D4G869_MICCO